MHTLRFIFNLKEPGLLCVGHIIDQVMEVFFFSCSETTIPDETYVWETEKGFHDFRRYDLLGPFQNKFIHIKGSSHWKKKFRKQTRDVYCVMIILLGGILGVRYAELL